MISGSCTQRPSSENIRTCARDLRHRAELGDLDALEPDRDRADRVHVDQPDLLAAAPHVLDDDGGVGHRVGVGHREHGGVAAARGGPGAGLDRLGLLAARLPQVGVQVDEAGQQHGAVGVEDLAVGAQSGADLDDHSVAHEQVDASSPYGRALVISR